MDYLAIAIAVVSGVLIGVFVGILIGVGRMKKAIEARSVGHLRIDRSESDLPPRPFLEVIGTDIDSISKKDFVILKIVNENYLSNSDL